MATIAHHSQKAVIDIIKEMTRPISDILGEPPLTPLESRPRKRSRPIPLRSRETSLDADIIAITRSYQGPDPYLQGGRVSGELGPPRKRSRVDSTLPDSLGKKRRREEKPPLPENGSKKRDRESAKKPRTEQVKLRSTGIKLTSQPNPRNASDETAKKPRLSSTPLVRKKETKKLSKRELDDEPKKESKETSRKRPPTATRIPASVVPRSEPRPLKPRVPASEKLERHRHEEVTRTATKESPQRSASSSERRRPRSRQINDDPAHQRDHELATDRDLVRRDKKRNRERDRDRESDRERSDRERDNIRRSSGRTDREKDIDKTRDRITGHREKGSERDGKRENEKRDDEADRGRSDRAKDRARDYNRDRERPSLRRSVPSSRPDSAREATPTRQSPRDSRGVPVTAKAVAGEGVGSKSARPRHGRADLQENLVKQKNLEKEFRRIASKCEELYKNKNYDAFEEKGQEGFRVSFDLGLAMETELRLQGPTLRSMTSSERTARKRTVIDHYKSMKTYASKRMKELEAIGRKEGCAFYKRGVQKVYFRIFCCHNLLDKDVQTNNRNLKLHLDETVNARRAGKSKKLAEEELSMRKLMTLQRLVNEHVNIVSIFESITADYGCGFEEAGAEGYVP